MPFLILALLGVIVYLASVIGQTKQERESILALIDESRPEGTFSLPEKFDTRRWKYFSASDSVRFKYPLNWRISPTDKTALIRDGEGAFLSVALSDAETSGESIVAYRVARISALQDLGYEVREVLEAELAGTTALVLEYGEKEGAITFYETSFLHGGQFYSLVLFVKENLKEAEIISSLKEYKQMLATIAF